MKEKNPKYLKNTSKKKFSSYNPIKNKLYTKQDQIIYN